MKGFEFCESAMAGEACAVSAAFQQEVEAERQKEVTQKAQATTKVEGAEAKDATAEAQAGGTKQVEKSKAIKIAEETLQAIQKDLQQRQKDNGKLEEKDVKEILPKYFPKLEEAVKEADSNFETVIGAAKPEWVKLRPELEQFQQKAEPIAAKFGAAAEKVAEADVEKVGGLIDEYGAKGTSDARKKEIEKDLSQYPGLLDSYLEMAKLRSDNAAMLDKAQKIQAGVAQAVKESIVVRDLYAEALVDGGGDQTKAEKIAQESQLLQIMLMLGGPSTFLEKEEQQEEKVPEKKNEVHKAKL